MFLSNYVDKQPKNVIKHFINRTFLIKFNKKIYIKIYFIREKVNHWIDSLNQIC